MPFNSPFEPESTSLQWASEAVSARIQHLHGAGAKSKYLMGRSLHYLQGFLQPKSDKFIGYAQLATRTSSEASEGMFALKTDTIS